MGCCGWLMCSWGELGRACEREACRLAGWAGVLQRRARLGL